MSNNYDHIETTDGRGETRHKETSEPEFESVSAEYIDIELESIVHAYGANGNLVQTFLPSNFDTSDQVIQAAGDALPDYGGRIVIPQQGPDNPSSAPESDVWEITKHIDAEGWDNVTIEGYGSPLLFLGDNVDEDIIRAGLDQSSPVTSNVTVRGIRFNGNRANQNTFSNRDPDGDGNTEIKGSVGIRPIRCSDWTIEDCHFQDFKRFGYCAKLTQGPMVVRDSTGDNCQDDAFTVSNEFFQVQDPDSAKHTFENIEGTNCGDQGIEIEDGARNVTVRDSRFSGSDTDQATVKSHGGSDKTDEQPCENVTFENCTFVSDVSNGWGLKLYGAFTGNPRNINARDCDFIVDGGAGGVALSKNDDLVRNETYDVDITDCYIDIQDGNYGVRHFGQRSIHGLRVDVEIDNHASAIKGIALNGTLDGATLTATIHGNGLLNHGISLRSIEDHLNDVTITEETHVEGCLGNGVDYRHDSNNITAKIKGTYKNNGQDDTLPDNQRCGVSMFNANGSPTDNIVVDVRAYDDQATKTQQYGLYRDGGDYNIFDNINVRGNALSGVGGTLGTNSQEGTIIT